MGVSGFSYSGCCTNPTAAAPNPSPSNFEILKIKQFDNAYLLKVKYYGCTNFEGIKIMVYIGQYKKKEVLDPHFADSLDSPIARFKPTPQGYIYACMFAESIWPVRDWSENG